MARDQELDRVAGHRRAGRPLRPRGPGPDRQLAVARDRPERDPPGLVEDPADEPAQPVEVRLALEGPELAREVRIDLVAEGGEGWVVPAGGRPAGPLGPLDHALLVVEAERGDTGRRRDRDQRSDGRLEGAPHERPHLGRGH